MVKNSLSKYDRSAIRLLDLRKLKIGQWQILPSMPLINKSISILG